MDSLIVVLVLVAVILALLARTEKRRAGSSPAPAVRSRQGPAHRRWLERAAVDRPRHSPVAWPAEWAGPD
jgi:hypothetical protein